MHAVCAVMYEGSCQKRQGLDLYIRYVAKTQRICPKKIKSLTQSAWSMEIYLCGKCAEELARQVGQVLNHQLQGPKIWANITKKFPYKLKSGLWIRIRVVDPNPDWIRIQWLCGSGSVLGIRIRIQGQENEEISVDPDWAKMLDPDPY
jgi:hypothetical protein